MRFASPYAAGHGDPHFGRFHLEAENLVTNGGFETNATGWTNFSTGSTVARTTDERFSGVASLQVTGNDGVDSAGTAVLTANPVPVQAYTAQARVKGEGDSLGRTFSLILREGGGSQGAADIASATVTLTEDWQYLEVTGTPAQADRTSLSLRGTITAEDTGEVFYMDNVQVEVGTFATPYIHTDGAAAGRIATRYG